MVKGNHPFPTFTLRLRDSLSVAVGEYDSFSIDANYYSSRLRCTRRTVCKSDTSDVICFARGVVRGGGGPFYGFVVMYPNVEFIAHLDG